MKPRKHVKAAALLLALSMAFSLASCAYRFPDDYLVRDRKTGKTSSEFGLYISQPNVMGSWVKTWLGMVNRYDGFQYYIYSDTDSWDVYLFYPDRSGDIAKLKNSDVTVELEEETGTLMAYVEYSGTHTELQEGEADWLLHFVANPKGKWPHYVRLFWNGEEVVCDDEKVYEL